MRLSSLFDDTELCARIRAAELDAIERLSSLTPGQRRVLDELVDGHPNKVVAYRLGLSPRTVENHRQAIMGKLGVRSVLALARLVVIAG